MHRRAFAFTCLAASTLFLLPMDASAQEKQKPRQRKTPEAFAPIEVDPNLPNVLLIGDSISIGYTLPAREALAGQANVHRPAANCGSTQTGIASLDKWLGDRQWDVIHFNWGLHDLKFIDGKQVTPIKEYEANLRKLVERLQQTKAKLIWCSTTPVPDGELSPPRSNKDVQAYNAVALEVMKEHGVEVDDLYAFAFPQLKEIQRTQNVHFTPEGSKVLAGQVAKSISGTLKKSK